MIITYTFLKLNLEENCYIPRMLLLLLLLLLCRFSRVQLCDPIDSSPPRLPRPWGSPGKNTGVGCHFLLQCIKVKSENEVAQSCPTLRDPMDCSLPGSFIHGIFQARVLEWGAIAFSNIKMIYGKIDKFFSFELFLLFSPKTLLILTST